MTLERLYDLAYDSACTTWYENKKKLMEYPNAKIARARMEQAEQELREIRKLMDQAKEAAG